MSCVEALVALLLLACGPCLAGSSGPGPGPTWSRSDPGPGPGQAADVLVLWDQLRGLKELVLRLSEQDVDRRLAVRSLESRVQDQQLRSQEHSERIGGLETLQVQVNTTQDHMLGLSRSCSRIDALEEKNSELVGQLAFLETRLRASESTVEQLRRRNAVLSARVCSTENQVEELRRRCSVGRPADGSGPPEGAPGLAVLQTQVDSCSSELEVLQTLSSNHTEALVSMESRLVSMEMHLGSTPPLQVEQLMVEDTGSPELSELRIRMNQTENRLDLLSTLNASKPTCTAPLAAVRGELEQLDGRLTALESSLRSNDTALLALQEQVLDHASQLLRWESPVNVSQSLLEPLKTQQNRVSDLEVAGSTTRGRLEELWELQRAHEAKQVAMASRLAAGESQRGALESRLEAEEAVLRTLKTQSSGLSADLSALEARMNSSESKTAGVEATAGVLSRLWGELRANASVMERQMDGATQRLDQWMSQNQDPTRVAFSAGLSDAGAVGPFGDETTLVFSKTLTNIGQAYNQTTGVFRAPVRGLYCFLFTVADFLKGYRGVYLYRNAGRVLFSLELNAHGGYASSSVAAPLLLEAGDTVYLRLPGSYRLYDDDRSFSLFSGFLLFPL